MNSVQIKARQRTILYIIMLRFSVFDGVSSLQSKIYDTDIEKPCLLEDYTDDEITQEELKS